MKGRAAAPIRALLAVAMLGSLSLSFCEPRRPSASTRRLRVGRSSDLNPAAESSREAAVEAIKAVPFTAAPGDLAGGMLQVVIIPLFIGVFIVYLVTVFKPDLILTDDQMVEYKKAEKQYFLEKRGAIRDPDAPADLSRAGRRKARSLKGKRRVKSES